MSHLAASNPQRPLYFCVQEKYEDQSRREAAEFRRKVLDYKQTVLAKASNPAADQGSTLNQEILRNVNQIVDSSLPRMMELIQLEPGRYKLTLEVRYRNPRSRFFRRLTATSSAITFSIGPDVREVFRVNLRQVLLVGATNLILDQQTPFIWPEYNPLEVQEAT